MTDREKLEKLILEIDNLIDHYVKPSTPAFQAWFSNAERFLIKKFGDNSFEHRQLNEIKFMPSLYTSSSEIISKCKNGLVATKLIFKTYLDEMEEDDARITEVQTKTAFDKVFIVHGHDGELKHSVARLVEKQGLQAIILSKQANKGKTIIEKFEENSDVSGAICLFTADDYGHAKTDSNEQPRSRQNVVFEAGYFMGKLGRNRVIIIAENDVELPSDMQGIVYSNRDNWELDALKEMKAMGYSVDLNKLF